MTGQPLRQFPQKLRILPPLCFLMSPYLCVYLLDVWAIQNGRDFCKITYSIYNQLITIIQNPPPGRVLFFSFMAPSFKGYLAEMIVHFLVTPPANFSPGWPLLREWSAN